MIQTNKKLSRIMINVSICKITNLFVSCLLLKSNGVEMYEDEIVNFCTLYAPICSVFGFSKLASLICIIRLLFEYL